MDRQQTTTYQSFVPLRDELVSYADSLLHNHDDAQDFVQNLYIILWNRRDTLSGIENPRAYSRTVLRNLCMDEMRRVKSAGRGEMPLDVESDELSAVDKVSVQQMLDYALTVMESLPEGQRVMLQRKAVGDESYEDIAAQTGMSPQTMRTQLSLGRKTLRTRLAWAFVGAAMVVAAVITGINRSAEPKDTFTDPAMAYAELERRLGSISKSMDKASRTARNATPTLEDIEQIIKNH